MINALIAYLPNGLIRPLISHFSHLFARVLFLIPALWGGGCVVGGGGALTLDGGGDGGADA